MNHRPRILYIETARAAGGSSVSLMELVGGLDRTQYEPLVLFYHTTPYVQKLRKQGVRVIVMREQTLPQSPSPLLPRRPERDMAARLRRYGRWLGTAYQYAKESYWLARRDWPLARDIARLVEAEGIDLVHHNNSLRGNQGAILGARLADVPQICHVRMLHPYPPFAPITQRFITAFIYISKAVEAQYLAWGISPARGCVIHNPINPVAFGIAAQGTATDGAALRTALGLAAHDRLISNVGRLSWWKGQDYFIQAMAAVIQAEPQAKALIVGAPDTTSPREHAYYQQLQQLVHSLGLADKIHFTGFRSDVPAIMAASDVVVHSASEPEPFGRVIVEAMMAARPLVATAAGGVLEIVEDQETGLLVPPKDAVAMANAITYLLQHPEIAATVGACARQRATTRYTVEQHVQQVTQVYEAVLGRWRQR